MNRRGSGVLYGIALLGGIVVVSSLANAMEARVTTPGADGSVHVSPSAARGVTSDKHPNNIVDMAHLSADDIYRFVLGRHTRRRVVVTGVAAGVDTAKVDYKPVTGAKDYRILDVSNPDRVKYAGMIHLSVSPYCGCHFVMQPADTTPAFPYATAANTPASTGPKALDVPSAEIEWNGIGDGKAHILVVQALDQLGPAPQANLYDWNNNPTHGASGMPGANAGPTADGLLSIDGQGPATDTPEVIAQSQPFVVQANPTARPVPSRPDATQTFFDTFSNGEAATLQRVGPTYPITGAMIYTLNADTDHAWDIRYAAADTRNSMPMIMDDHFMDVLFDGSTPGFDGNAVHTQYATMAMVPHQSADLSGGKLLHLTEEVDNHSDGRRWMQWFVAPAGDPIGNFRFIGPTDALNRSDTGFTANVTDAGCNADEYLGRTSASDARPIVAHLASTSTGASSGPDICADDGYPTPQLQTPGLDNRTHLDLFLSATKFAIFANGHLLTQYALKQPLPFAKANVYFTHYAYHTALEHDELAQYRPWESYWIDRFPYSDERHWDNMGFEVLPAAAVPAGSWMPLVALIKIPKQVKPHFAATDSGAK